MPKFTVSLTHTDLKSSFSDEMKLVDQPGGGLAFLEGAVASKLNKWFENNTRPPNRISSIKATAPIANTISFEMHSDKDLADTKPMILNSRGMNTNDVKLIFSRVTSSLSFF